MPPPSRATTCSPPRARSRARAVRRTSPDGCTKLRPAPGALATSDSSSSRTSCRSWVGSSTPGESLHQPWPRLSLAGSSVACWRPRRHPQPDEPEPWKSGGMGPADLDFVSGDFWGGDPHAALTWLRHNDPVCWNDVGGCWGITKYDDIKEISKHPAVWSSAGGIRPDSGPTGMMIEQDDPVHWRRRKLVNKGFTPQQVRAQEPKVRSIVDRLLDRVIDQGQCDFVTDVAAWLPLIMIGDALGFDESDHPTLLKWSDDLMRGLGQDDPEKLTSMMAAFDGYTRYMAGVIADRRMTPRDDLTSILVHAEVDGDRFDDDTLVHETLLILIGGDETTRHVITGGLYQLMTHRDQWDALLANRSLLPSAVEEMLRWVSPIKN